MWDRTLQQRAAYPAAAQRWAVRDCLRRTRTMGGIPLNFSEFARARLRTSARNAFYQPAHTVFWRLRGSALWRID